MYEDMIPAELHDQLATTAPPFILDVREPAEFAEAAIAGAVNIPLGDLVTRVGELPQDRSIVAVCRSGNRSGKAAAALDAAGLKVSNLSGGMLAWIGERRPFVEGAIGVAPPS